MKRLLILDDYGNHYLYKFECYCKKNNIVIFCIPLHSFHLFQPFDIGCFNVLKQSYSKEVENFIQSHINYIIKPDFFIYFYTIFFAIFNKENIRVGFRSTSLIPSNPKAVISKLDIKLYTPISIGPLSTEVDS